MALMPPSTAEASSGGYRARRSLTILAAFEALVGLLIEVTFIATLTRRLFGKRDGSRAQGLFFSTARCGIMEMRACQ